MTKDNSKHNVEYNVDALPSSLKEDAVSSCEKNKNLPSLKLKLLIIRFVNSLEMVELPFFRGAVISVAGENNILFHNHNGTGFRYKYPLIQYKRISGKAAIVCVGEGIDEIGQFFLNDTKHLEIGNRSETFEVENISARTHIVQVWNTKFTYTTRKYLALNQDNYSQYESMDSLADKIKLLERCLVGNILSFAKSIGIYFDKEVIVNIVNIEKTRYYRFKGIRMLGFDIVFNTNVSLPDYIGLGKESSLGFGTICRTRQK